MTDAGSTPRRLPRRLIPGVMAVLALYTLAGFATQRVRRVDAEPAAARSHVPSRFKDAVRGVTSVHSEASHDAEGSRSDVARAARRAGLDFVVLSDHPARPPRLAGEPAFVDGVLLVDGREVTIRQDGRDRGRLMVFGLDTAITRWEGDVAALSRRLRTSNATAMVVHARSPRPHERWHFGDLDGVVGWEVLDVSQMARRRLNSFWAPFHIMDLLTGVPARWTTSSILRMAREGFDAPGVIGWDSIAGTRPFTATAGLNHHPKMRLLGTPFPGYGPFFRTTVNHLLVDGAFPADAVEAADSVAEGFQRGAVFISLGEAPRADGFRFVSADDHRVVAEMNESTPFRPGLRLQAGVFSLASGRLLFRVIRNGRTIAWQRGHNLDRAVDLPGSYRVEVYRYGLRLGSWYLGFRPWILSNTIRFHDDPAPAIIAVTQDADLESAPASASP